MNHFSQKKFVKHVKSTYKAIITLGQNTLQGNDSEKKEIRQNGHVIRSCCLNILQVQKEFAECSLSDSGEPVILEEALDFCEISDYILTEESVMSFFRKLSKRRNLSYAEISCLVPVIEYCCIRRISECEDSVQKLIRSLHVLNDLDCSSFAEMLSNTEDVLKRDDIFPHLDNASKNLYREKIRRIAKKTGKEERETAVELLKESRKEKTGTMRQIGGHLLKEKKNRFYVPILSAIALVFLVITFIFFKNTVIFTLSVIPAILSAKLLCDTLFSKIIKPELLPKIKITKDNCPSVLVTVISMVATQTDAKKLLHRLDVLNHRIPISRIRIGLLLDMPRSKSELTEEEEVLLNFLKSEIKIRNKQNNRFFCAVRKREWVADEFHYEAFGRKQGAIMDFCDLIVDKSNAFSLSVGNICSAEYLVALDADTEPTPGSVESLIGFMEHPNHTPSIKTDKRGFSYVEKGYGVAAPRIDANPESSFRTPYSAMMSGNTGTEFYKNPHFNLYQDLFSEGIFCGKGILRIPLYQKLISQRFYKDPILSHDLVEGEILRCANVCDVVFFDEIPETIPSDEKRTHRWTRGDFQNAKFLSLRQTNSGLFRFKIIHNLLRPYYWVSCFLLFTVSTVFGAKVLFAPLFWLLFPLFLRIPVLVTSILGKVRRYHPLREFADSCLETALNILLLPSRTANAIDSSFRGIFRSICGKKKLEWTTAANSSSTGRDIGVYFYQLRWQVLGFFFLFFTQTTFFGALWIVAPLVAHYISMPYPKDKPNTEELKTELASMWKYYSELMNEKSHWLPPDNYQQEPLNIVAQRTSPTNIGLALLCVLGAFDLKLVSEQEMLSRIEKALNTIEGLPKWKGHLFNWYDTQTLKVLSPKFVSTVDCGNYAASLYTLKNGLKKLDGERVRLIVERLERILAETDFSLLYDAKKKLFPIGYDATEDKMSSSYYDLYASEARLTSFYAIMMHQISPEHWSRLARPAGSERGNLILYSWSGTMFEYFMPHLFLPAYRRTLSGEMLRGVVSAQVHHAGKNIPWGISESCYYSFDALLNYQYRAFGIPQAALRRDLSFPKVISPYSTFLVYPWFPSISEKNKTNLPKGRYGYYEAVDYRSGVDNPRTVQCFMAHHVGMSFLAGVNILKEKAIQKRFMEGAGEAFVSLLTERIPVYSKDYFWQQNKEKERWQPTEVRIEKPDPEHPRIKLLSNGKMTEIFSDSGAGVLRAGDRDLTKYSADPYAPHGVFLFVQNKGSLFGTTYAPLYQSNTYRMFFDNCGASCYGSFQDFETRTTLTLVPDLPVSVRELTIKNNQMTENGFEFILFCEPVLAHRRAYQAHPEYLDLFLTSEYDPAIRTITFCRNQDGKELWFAVAASEPFRFDVRRDSFGSFDTVASGKTEGGCPHPIFSAVVLRGHLNIRGRGTGTVRFFLSCGSTKQEAVDGIRKAATQNFEVLRRRYAQVFDALCVSFDIRAADRLIFDQICSRVLIPWEKSSAETKISNSLSIQTLWKFGISGDNPIVTIRIGQNTVSRVITFIKSAIIMTYAGLTVDFVILYKEKEGYNTPIKTEMSSILSEVNENVRSRIYILNVETMEDYLLLQKCSALFVNLERGWKLRNPQRSFRPIHAEGKGLDIQKPTFPLGRGGYGKNGSFLISKTTNEPLRPWSLLFANRRIGTLLTERSLGYTFGENASENRITPRIPGACHDLSGEKYYANIKGKKYDLLRNASVEYHRDSATYQLELLGNKIKTEVFVPPYLAAKIIRVSVEGASQNLLEIVYEPKIILGKENQSTVTRFLEDERIFYTNACNDSYGKGVAILFGSEVRPEGNSLHFIPNESVCSATFVLAYAGGLKSARRISGLLSSPDRVALEAKKAKAFAENYIRIETPDKELNFFFNGFLQQQIKVSRLFARTGPSQPGGAYGFRDQLQDSLCLAPFDPAYLKQQILRCAAHQFEEGDVLHWWHPRPHSEDDGIRTRFSDDPFWLVYACSEYFRITEDELLFLRKRPYLSASLLKNCETDRYFRPQRSNLKETVYRHALQAFRYGMKTGQHGLILFGSGDWNDGMNRVEEGGETVWGTMFALLSAEQFLPLARILGTDEDVSYLKKCASDLRKALEENAFVHEKYVRGFHSHGAPFGNKDTIDLIPQAFSVFCGMKTDASSIAMDHAYKTLWDPKHRMIRLLAPPYTPQSNGFPGSIANYPPGVRENGGQYTHAGIWFARALIQLGKIEEAWEILSGINPVSHARTPCDAVTYGAEPYVMSADVYALPGREGFAGWSHYTGAAGWYLKTVTEDLLGIYRKGMSVFIRPAIPKQWNGYRAEVKMGRDCLRIQVERGTDTGVYDNGKKVSSVPLCGQNHDIIVIV